MPSTIDALEKIAPYRVMLCKRIVSRYSSKK